MRCSTGFILFFNAVFFNKFQLINIHFYETEAVGMYDTRDEGIKYNWFGLVMQGKIKINRNVK